MSYTIKHIFNVNISRGGGIKELNDIRTWRVLIDAVHLHKYFLIKNILNLFFLKQ
jgi:hypothetical protein